MGAAGYLIKPTDISRFVARLKPVIETPGDRRFTRYPQRLAMRVRGSAVAYLATQVGRGGIFISTDEEVERHTAMQCAIELPELGRALNIDGEVLYRSHSQGAEGNGLGLRFCEISPEDEALLIEYLAWIESTL